MVNRNEFNYSDSDSLPEVMISSDSGSSSSAEEDSDSELISSSASL